MGKLRKLRSRMKETLRPLLDDSFRPNGYEQAEIRQPLVQDQMPELTKRQEDGSRIIQEMAQNLPKPPEDLPGNLPQYLLTLQETVSNSLSRLGPHLKDQESLGTPLECYHSQIFQILDELLQKTDDTRSLFMLMQWVQSSLSLEKVDLLLLAEWVTNAKSKLLQSVKEYFRVSAQKILKIDRKHTDVNDEEACVQFYVDIISLTESMPKAAVAVSSTLAADVRQACFAELLSFLERYVDEKTETLKKKTRMDEREMIYFLKTLKACTEIKQYVSTNLTKTNHATRPILTNITEVLENMENFTFTCVKKETSNTAEGFLQTYFTTNNKQFLNLIDKVQTWFPKKDWCQDGMKKVVVEVYKIIAHVYVTQLVKVRPKKLTKSWSPDVSQTIRLDAKNLHNTISEMVPGVEPFNQMMLTAAELQECDFPDTLILTTVHMHEECLILREDLDLQMALLRWNGLSARKARRMLEEISGHQTSRIAFWTCCLPYCTRPTSK